MNADPGRGEAGGWPRWAAAVREALARRSLSVNAAAEQLGVRNTTLGRWLDAAAPPQLSLLPRIAELTGLTHAIQLELGGVLPPAMRAEAHAIQVTSELSSAVGTIAEVVARAGELAFSDAGARLAGILLSHEGADLQVTLRRAYRGHRYPVHLSTYVGVQRIHPDGGAGDAAQGDAVQGNESLRNESLRHRVTEIVGESARAFGAQWREQEPHDWPPPRPNLILTVPQHERPRPPAAAALGAAPDILLLGCPYAYAEYIGALLADALGYGYLDVRYSVPTPLDLDPAAPEVTAARIRFVRRLTADGAATRKHVWSVADHRVLPAVTGDLAGAEVACAVYVRSGDRLLARGAEIWNVPLEEMVKLRATLDDLTETAPWSVLTLCCRTSCWSANQPDQPDPPNQPDPPDPPNQPDPPDPPKRPNQPERPVIPVPARASTETASPTWPCSPPSTSGGTCTATVSCPAPPPRADGCGRCSTGTAARKATRGDPWSPGPAACRPGARSRLSP